VIWITGPRLPNATDAQQPENTRSVAGLGHAALHGRITDARAKIVIAGDVGYRRGKTVALKSIVDEALESLDFVQKVIVISRAKTEITGPREIDFNDLLKFPPHCPAEQMDAEDPLFLLYTSGSTGKPKGVVHVHGGYMVHPPP
jgi:acetyl-CoA synthetase